MVVEKPGTQHLTQVIKVNIISYRIQQPPDMMHGEEHTHFLT